MGHDRRMVRELCEVTTEGAFSAQNVVAIRLGPRQGGHSPRSRPLLVKLPDSGTKALVMRNLHKLKAKGVPYSEMIVKHDMCRDDREKERILQKEAREQSMEDKGFMYLVRGLPGQRKLVKVKKRKTNKGPIDSQQEEGATGGTMD